MDCGDGVWDLVVFVLDEARLETETRGLKLRVFEHQPEIVNSLVSLLTQENQPAVAQSKFWFVTALLADEERGQGLLGMHWRWWRCRGRCLG